MESQYQKWVNLSYLACAILLGYVVFELSMKLTGVYDIEARIRNIDLVVRGLSVLAGVLLFVILYRNDQANQFMNEVVAELARVTWPTQKETSSATVVVIAMVLISGLFLGMLDYVFTQLMKWIL